MISLLDRVLGCLYGIAIGDAMGMPTSFLTPEEIQQRYGWVDTFYDPKDGHIYHQGLRAGEVTDDTEQSLALVRSFVRNKKVVPPDIVSELFKWAERVKHKYVSPLGPSTERSFKLLKNGGNIHETGVLGDTNGSGMRIAPLGIIHGLRKSDDRDLISDVYLTCLPTHNTTVAIAAAGAIAKAIALSMEGVSNMDQIILQTRQVAEEATKFGAVVAGASISKRIELAKEIVQKNNCDKSKTMRDFYDIFGGGVLAADSIPLAVGIFYLANGNVKETIEIAVNLGGDCDTIGAMAGAIAGTYSGVAQIPAAWRNTIKSKNQIDLETVAQELIGLAPQWTISSDAN